MPCVLGGLLMRIRTCGQIAFVGIYITRNQAVIQNDQVVIK